MTSFEPGRTTRSPRTSSGPSCTSKKGLYSVTSLSPLLVIDGQQRLTTITLLIEALARSMGETELIEGFSAAKLRGYYLLNTMEAARRSTSYACRRPTKRLSSQF